MKVKKYDEFISEEINLRNAIVGGAIGASALVSNPAAASEPVKPNTNKDSLSTENAQAVKETIDFVENIESDKPDLFTNEEISSTTRLEFGKFEKLSYLQDKVQNFEESNGVHLNLDLLSRPSSGIPFRINYFYVRGLDDVNNGPFLIRIINVDFNNAIKLGGHEIHFNFTRLPDVTTFGTRINF